MLELDVVVSEAYDEFANKFVSTRQRVQLEHSLASLSKWESSFEKPFLGPAAKSHEETFAYIEMMVIGSELTPDVLLELVKRHSTEIQDYIDRQMTATKIAEVEKKQGRRQTITSELIYSWMVELQIDFQTQYWHLNRLITLIRVLTLKNAPKKKMTAAERQQLNRQRQAKHNTRG